MKVHKYKSTISQEFYRNDDVTDEYFIRETCYALVKQLTEKDLKKLFNIKILDPMNKEYDSKNIKWAKVVNQRLRNKLMELEIQNVLEITAEINEIN